MKRPATPPFFLLLLLLLIPQLGAVGCSGSTIVTIAHSTIRGDYGGAARAAGAAAIDLALSPGRLVGSWDALIERIKSFFDTIQGIWGADDAEGPSPHIYVKYVNNYLSRASVDFDAGVIRIETLDQERPLERLREAIVTTLLTPEDPAGVDLFSAEPILLTGAPYLLGQVLDEQGERIENPEQAERFADYLTANQLNKDVRQTPQGERTHYWVRVEMAPDHLAIRAARYAELIKTWADAHGVSRNLVFAITHTESDFNPFAVSSAPAFGLMQIVPTTAGRDAYQFIHGEPGTPSQEYLFNAENNIRMGTAYLKILQTRLLDGIGSPVTMEYCMIAAYNGGPGRLLRLFHQDRVEAINAINRLTPAEVHERIMAGMSAQTQRYLLKVLRFKRLYVRI